MQGPRAEQLLDDIPRFERQQAQRCARIGIDVSAMPVSHVAVRCRTWREYVALRDELETLCSANSENVWNGRPISKIVLRRPPVVDGGREVPLIELIPPFHQRVYAMGLEHVGYVVGETFPSFVRTHEDVLTGQQFQSPVCRPVYRLFDDYTHVKLYERSLLDACRLEGARFDGIVHADWSPASPDAGPYEVS